jgi:hypothetical protein
MESVSMTKATLMIALVLLTAGSLFAKEPVGKIFSVKGEATIAHLLKKRMTAVVNEPVFEKDKIKTESDGEVVIMMSDQTKITVSAGSYLKINTKSKGKKGSSELALFGGKVGFEVKPLGDEQTFTVRTPSAVAGVRGTHGQMSYDMNTGVTGARSLPHTDGTKAKSVVVATQIENAGQIDAMTKGSGGSDDSSKVVNEGEASFHTADGEAALVTIGPGEELTTKGGEVVVAMIQDKATEKSRARFEAMDADRVAQLELLEARLNSMIQTNNREIPGLPVGTPSN